MSFSTRITRLEAKAKVLAAKPLRCPTCRSPIPCAPSSIFLVEDGLMFQTSPCETCGGPGGGGLAIPFDPELGPIGSRQPMIAVAGITLTDWLERHEGRRFGTHLDPFFDWLRGSRGAG